MDNIFSQSISCKHYLQGESHLWLTTPLTAGFIKVVAKNNGTIAIGEPGGGNNTWLFVDEIEVN